MALWIDGRLNPAWVKAELAFMTPGSVSKSLYSWNAMISRCVASDQGLDALKLYNQMHEEGVKPDTFTFARVLNACASAVTLEEGRHVHAQVIQSGCEFDVFVGSTLVDMYGKCGSIEEAQRVFQTLPTREVVSWTALLAGYVKCEQGHRALELFVLMQEEGVKCNRVTFLVLLNACSSIMALEVGRCLHAQLIQSGCESDMFVENTLVDMYAKCGSVQDAERVFHRMSNRDVVSWNAMLCGFAMHGKGRKALELFQEMHQTGVKMNRVTFICILSACSHGGLVEEGIQLFNSMGSVYGISQTVDHYICMVDILGRAGRLDEAENLFKNESGIRNNTIALSSFLAACRNHGKLEMGERVARQLLKSSPDNATGYMLLSNIYAASGHWDSCDMVREMRKERGVKKRPGRTWIVVENEVHSFVVDDQFHPQIEDIHSELQRLSKQMEQAGYVPDTRVVLHNVGEEEKMFRLCHHSEKLAIAFGLIRTAPGTPLQMYKNLRACVDCHTATKFMSKIVGRKIVVRDINRFHHFQEGVCSCGDYW